MINLLKLISPLPIQEFFERHFEKQHFFNKCYNTSNFNSILSIQEINNFLNKDDLRFPCLQIIKNGKVLDENEFTKSASTLISNQIVFKYFDEGHTIKIQDAHYSFNNLSSFCKELSIELNLQVKANVYLTPPNSIGFNAHYDSHDVFVLQVYGLKNWNIYDVPFELPLESNYLSYDSGLNYKEIEPSVILGLQEGDLLYIPRGLVHNAFTKNNISAHITIGLYPFKNIDILKKIIKEAENRVFFRQSISNALNIDIVKNEINILLDDFFSNSPYLENYTQRHLFVNDLITIEKIHNMSLKTKVCMINDIDIIISHHSDSIELKTATKSIIFPKFLTESLNYILSSKCFIISELKGLSDLQSKLVLCKRLAKEGLILIENDFNN